jgi:hypothetical protein
LYLYELLHLLLLSLTPDKAALFASFLSAFLVYILPKIQSNPADLTVELLRHISIQLQNASTPAYEQETFEAPQEYILANALFLGSLAFLLVTAFLAMLVKGWVRDFDRDLPSVTVAEERARERERRMRSLIYWRLPQLVALLPVLTLIALVLFCAGLVIVLRAIQSLIANVTAGCLGTGLLMYTTTTLISMYDPFSPFPSPISRGLSGIFTRIDGLRRRWTNLPLAWGQANPYVTYSSPLLAAVITLFRRLNHIFSSENEPAGTLTERESLLIKHARNLSVDVSIMNSLGDTTLVAPENIATFHMIIKQIGSDGQIWPTKCPRWLDVLTMISPTLHRIPDRETWQGLARIITRSVELDLGISLHQTIFAGMSRRLSEGKGSDLGSDLITARLSTLCSEVDIYHGCFNMESGLCHNQ